MELRYLSMSKKSNILNKQIKNETRCINPTQTYILPDKDGKTLEKSKKIRNLSYLIY